MNVRFRTMNSTKFYHSEICRQHLTGKIRLRLNRSHFSAAVSQTLVDRKTSTGVERLSSVPAKSWEAHSRWPELIFVFCSGWFF